MKAGAAGETRLHLVYDGTFDGLMSALAGCYRNGITPSAISVDAPSGLFADHALIETDRGEAEAMQATLRGHIGAAALRTVVHAFLSEASGREMTIWNYLQLARSNGTRVSSMLAHEPVIAIEKLACRVRHEAHRLKGFVRFQEVEGGLYYSAVEPDHDVLELLAAHFATRFHDQHWMIHDLRRDKALLYDRDRREWLAARVSLDSLPVFTDRERQFLTLWQTFFTAVAVAGRKNHRLQQQKVPRRYRKHLPEFAKR